MKTSWFVAAGVLVCILQTTWGTNPVCNLPLDEGPCHAYFPRYYYDVYTRQCQYFVFGGCGGNDNNFVTELDCQIVCGDSASSSVGHTDCLLPPDPGPCRGYFPRKFYDVNTGTCYEFIYGGCGGNPNNFESVYECESVCGASDEPKAWREDLRCGGGYNAPNGQVAQCDPNGIYPCCSTANWCGNTADHCACGGCIDFSG